MKRLAVFDFDGTLMNSPEKEVGIPQWEKVKGQPYPYKGWWGRRESLDTEVFDIKPFPLVLAQLEKEKATPDTQVIILTSRMEKLRSEVEKILDANGIVVDDVILKRGNEDKGDIILKIEKYNQDLKEIVVYDDFADRDAGKIAEYTKIKDLLKPDVQYTIYYVNNDSISLLESSNSLLKIINEEINNFVADDNYVYHGTYDGAGFSIQRVGGMKINAANNGEPFISFTSKPNTAKYYADMKGGSGRSVILRTKKTQDFKLSPKFKKNDGYEWITTREIPIEELEINTKYGWIPLNNWDFVDKDIKK
jgi:hypothetical protein